MAKILRLANHFISYPQSLPYFICAVRKTRFVTICVIMMHIFYSKTSYWMWKGKEEQWEKVLVSKNSQCHDFAHIILFKRVWFAVWRDWAILHLKLSSMKKIHTAYENEWFIAIQNFLYLGASYPTGPQATLAGPQTPLVGPQTPLSGPYTPLSDTQNPLAGLQTPLVGPQTPTAGPQTTWIEGG